MSVQQKEREAVASRLIEHVKTNDIPKVEGLFSHFSEDSQWRDIVRYEFSIKELLQETLHYDVVIPRLLSYEIKTISPIHYAAFKGHNDIIVNFIDHDVPVDVTLGSGATPLHLAAFGGKVETVRMLIEVYKADINKQDNYGWSALHFAGTEGHNEVILTLVEMGINVNLRDQDGTSAAFRAQVNGYEDIVDILCELEDDLLNVDPAYEGKSPKAAQESLYSTVKPKWASASVNSPNPPNLQTKSATLAAKASSGQEQNTASAKRKKYISQTLPKNFMENKTSTIRRIIRKELAAAMDEETTDPDYMLPGDVQKKKEAVDESDKFALAGIGVNTLKGIMREEIGKYAKEMFRRSQSEDTVLSHLDTKDKPKHNPDYEDIYETVKHFDNSLKVFDEDDEDDLPEEAPPLPPRNLDRPSLSDSPEQATSNGQQEITTVDTPGYYMLHRASSGGSGGTDSMALKESIRRIGPILGSNWKKLAYALPLDKTPQLVLNRVVAIEKRLPDDDSKQASMALAEWMINKGSSANVDDLVVALRKCGLVSLIEDVQRAEQEFTA